MQHAEKVTRSFVLKLILLFALLLTGVMLKTSGTGQPAQKLSAFYAPAQARQDSAHLQKLYFKLVQSWTSAPTL